MYSFFCFIYSCNIANRNTTHNTNENDDSVKLMIDIIDSRFLIKYQAEEYEMLLDNDAEK